MVKRHGQKPAAPGAWTLQGWKGAISLEEFGRWLGDTGGLWHRYLEARHIDRRCRMLVPASGGLIAFCRDHDGDAFAKLEAEALQRLARDGGNVPRAKPALAAARQVQRKIRLSYLALSRELGDRATAVLEDGGTCRFFGARGSSLSDEVPSHHARRVQFDWVENRIVLGAQGNAAPEVWERVGVKWVATAPAPLGDEAALKQGVINSKGGSAGLRRVDKACTRDPRAKISSREDPH